MSEHDEPCEPAQIDRSKLRDLVGALRDAADAIQAVLDTAKSRPDRLSVPGVTRTSLATKRLNGCGSSIGSWPKCCRMLTVFLLNVDATRQTMWTKGKDVKMIERAG